MKEENNEINPPGLKALLAILMLPFILIFIVIGELFLTGIAENHNRHFGNYGAGSGTEIEVFIFSMILFLPIVRIIYHVLKIPPQPEPWDGLITEDDIFQTHIVCRHCLSIEHSRNYFCTNCSRSIGRYNNSMPFLWVAHMGEFLLDSVRDERKKGIFEILMFSLIGFGQYSILLPWYLYRVFRSNKGTTKSLPKD